MFNFVSKIIVYEQTNFTIKFERQRGGGVGGAQIQPELMQEG